MSVNGRYAATVNGRLIGLPGGVWTLFETLSPSGVATISSSILPPNDMWMVIVKVVSAGGTAVEHIVTLRFNDDSGNNYGHRIIDDTTVVTATAVSYMNIGSFQEDASTTTNKAAFMARLFIDGKDHGGTLNDWKGVFGMSTDGKGVSLSRFLNGYWLAQGSDVTKMTFDFGDLVTGKIQLYYLDL